MVSEEEPGSTVLFGARQSRAHSAGLRGCAVPRVPRVPDARRGDLGFPARPARRLCSGGVRVFPGGTREGGVPRRWGCGCFTRGQGVPSGSPPSRVGGLGGWVGAPELVSPASPPPLLVPLQEPGAGAPRWPRAAASGSCCRVGAGAPLPSGAQPAPGPRPTSGMGGGGSALRVCADHRGGINWLSLSPDGQRLLTGSEDGTARLWSTADGQCCALLQGRPAWPRPAPSRSVLFPARSPAADLGSCRRPLPQSPARARRGHSWKGAGRGGRAEGVALGSVSRAAPLSGRRAFLHRCMKSLPSPTF